MCKNFKTDTNTGILILEVKVGRKQTAERSFSELMLLSPLALLMCGREKA